MSIAQWPLAERPREKMLARGAGALSDAELLAILLRTGSHGRNAVDLGRELLARSGSLTRLLATPFETLRQIPGLGQAKILQFQAALEVARRMLGEGMQSGNLLDSPARVHDYLRLTLQDRSRERFACLFLDAAHRLISTRVMFEGTLTQTCAYPREIVRAALDVHAAAVLLDSRALVSAASWATRWRCWKSGCSTTSSWPEPACIHSRRTASCDTPQQHLHRILAVGSRSRSACAIIRPFPNLRQTFPARDSHPASRKRLICLGFLWYHRGLSFRLTFFYTEFWVRSASWHAYVK